MIGSLLPKTPANMPGARRSAMGDEPAWESIATAPYNRALELAVIEGGRVHPLIFACRRAPDGWVNIMSCERVAVSPTHWRPWQDG